MAPSLLWRCKSSTPRFPGAWPNTSVSSHASHVPVPQHDPPPQLPELLHIRPRSRGRDDHAQDDQYSLNERGLGWGFPTTSESHPVGGDIASGPQRWCRENPDPDENADKPLAFQTSPASGMAPLSTSFSQDSTFTEVTASLHILPIHGAYAHLKFTCPGLGRCTYARLFQSCAVGAVTYRSFTAF